jgi:hypothetical protein
MQTILNAIGALVKIIVQAVTAAIITIVLLLGFVMYAKAQEQTRNVEYVQQQFPGINQMQAELIVDGTWNTCLKNPLNGVWSCDYSNDIMDGETVMVSMSGVSRINLNR